MESTVEVKSLRGDWGDEVNVLIGMETADVDGVDGEGMVDFHIAVKGVVNDKIVDYADSMGFHRVALAIVVIANGRFVSRNPALFIALYACLDHTCRWVDIYVDSSPSLLVQSVTVGVKCVLKSVDVGAIVEAST